jgi:hypothetical protein
MIGMERTHSSHSSPTIILSQCERGAEPRLSAARNTTMRNGKPTSKNEIFRSPLGRAQPRQVNQRESGDPNSESELDREKNQRAGGRQVGADALDVRRLQTIRLALLLIFTWQSARSAGPTSMNLARFSRRRCQSGTIRSAARLKRSGTSSQRIAL